MRYFVSWNISRYSFIILSRDIFITRGEYCTFFLRVNSISFYNVPGGVGAVSELYLAEEHNKSRWERTEFLQWFALVLRM